MTNAHWAAVYTVLLAGCGQAEHSVRIPSAVLETAAVKVPQNGAKPVAGALAEVTSPADRKIIYRANLRLRIEDFTSTERQIAAAIKDCGGYLAEFHEDRQSGAQRSGRWLVRMPVDRFNSFLDATGSLGVAERREVQAEDITEEFVDLEARQASKQKLEARLLELVTRQTDEIKDVIALEAELARVREEIERLQGRMRYLSDRVALTTVEITAYERREYLPPESPTFSARLIATLFHSLDVLRHVAEAWAIALVAALPWLAVLSTLLMPLIWLGRRRGRRAIVA